MVKALLEGAISSPKSSVRTSIGAFTPPTSRTTRRWNMSRAWRSAARRPGPDIFPSALSTTPGLFRKAPSSRRTSGELHPRAAPVPDVRRDRRAAADHGHRLRRGHRSCSTPARSSTPSSARPHSRPSPAPRDRRSLLPRRRHLRPDAPQVAIEAGAQTVYVMAVSMPSPPLDRRSPLTILRHRDDPALFPRIRLDALGLPEQHASSAIVQVRRCRRRSRCGNVPPRRPHRHRLRVDEEFRRTSTTRTTGSTWPPSRRWNRDPDSEDPSSEADPSTTARAGLRVAVEADVAALTSSCGLDPRPVPRSTTSARPTARPAMSAGSIAPSPTGRTFALKRTATSWPARRSRRESSTTASGAQHDDDPVLDPATEAPTLRRCSSGRPDPARLGRAHPRGPPRQPPSPKGSRGSTSWRHSPGVPLYRNFVPGSRTRPVTMPDGVTIDACDGTPIDSQA